MKNTYIISAPASLKELKATLAELKEIRLIRMIPADLIHEFNRAEIKTSHTKKNLEKIFGSAPIWITE